MACLSTLFLGSGNIGCDSLRDTDVMPLLGFCKGSLTSIGLSGRSQLTEATVLLAVENSAGILTKLVLEGQCVTDKVVRRLADCIAARIQHLHLRCYTSGLSDAAIIYLTENIRAAGGGTLTHITLSSETLTDASICRLAECCGATLTAVCLEYGSFSDESILQIAEYCVKIRRLMIPASLLITDRSVVPLAELRGSQLTHLCVRCEIEGLTDASLDALARYCGVPGSEQAYLELRSFYSSDRIYNKDPCIQDRSNTCNMLPIAHEFLHIS